MHSGTYKKIHDIFWEKANTYRLSAQEIALCFSLTQFLVYNSNIAVCSISELQTLARISKKTLLKALTHLTETGIIEKHASEGYKNSYVLSYAHVGLVETKNVSSTSSKSEPGGGGNENQGVGKIGTTPIYVKHPKQLKTSSKREGEEESNLFIFDKERINLCKRNLKLLIELNQVKIKTSEAQYVKQMYINTEQTHSWEELKSKTSELEIEFDIVQSRPVPVALEESDQTKSVDKYEEWKQKVENLKVAGDYDRLFNKAFETLKRRNPNLDPDNSATRVMIESEMVLS